VLTCSQQTLRRTCYAVCEAAGIQPITVHQLRHTFASLCASLEIPMQISQKLGGWSTDALMKKIYIHVAKQDMDSSVSRLTRFFSANPVPKPMPK